MSYKVYDRLPHYIEHTPDWAMCEVVSSAGEADAVETVKQVVEVLNTPRPMVGGRYQVLSNSTFVDTQKAVTYVLAPDDEHYPYEDAYRIAGMLNSLEAEKQEA